MAYLWGNERRERTAGNVAHFCGIKEDNSLQLQLSSWITSVLPTSQLRSKFNQNQAGITHPGPLPKSTRFIGQTLPRAYQSATRLSALQPPHSQRRHKLVLEIAID